MRRHDGLLRAAKWPGAASWSAGRVTGAGRESRPAPAPGAEHARRAKPGHFAARRALFLALRARLVVLRSSRPVAENVLADDAESLATASQTPMREAPRHSPPIARSPREPCYGVASLRGRAQLRGRPRARRQRCAEPWLTPRSGRGRASARAAARRSARGATPMQTPYWSQGMNRYAYVFNDPINATDPSGFISMSDVVGGFVAVGHIGGFVVPALANGSLPTLGAVGVPTVGSSALTVPGLLQGQPGSGPTAVDTPLMIPQPPSLCSSGLCVAQNAGDPSTGAHGQGNLSADVPAQPTAGEVADVVTSVYPGGRGVKAGAKQVVKAGWLERAWKWAKGLFASESAAARAAPQASKALDPNKLHHIFGQAKHKLGPLLDKFGGSQEGAFRAVEAATQTAAKNQGLTGVFKTTVEVGGQNVVVKGTVIDSTAHIGSFWIP